VVTGVVVDRTGTFSIGFLIAAGFGLVGMIAYGLIVARIEPIDWRMAEPARWVPATPPRG
jgi:hypothetical protein